MRQGILINVSSTTNEPLRKFVIKTYYEYL